MTANLNHLSSSPETPLCAITGAGARRHTRIEDHRGPGAEPTKSSLRIAERFGKRENYVFPAIHDIGAAAANSSLRKIQSWSV